jgi:hypothetical protein
MQAVNIPKVPVGNINRFGEIGIIYQVGKPIKQLDNGDWLIEITLIETGEITECNLSNIQNDPKAE